MEPKEFLPKILDEAVAEAFSIISLSPERVTASRVNDFNEGVNSLIMFKGDLTGKINLFVPLNDASEIVSLMLGSNLKQEDHNEIIDGIGEVLNMIVGGVKTRSVVNKFDFEISVPSTRISPMPKDTQLNKSENLSKIYNFKEKEKLTFYIFMSYLVKEKEEEKKQEPETPKISAADLLSQLINKKMQQ